MKRNRILLILLPFILVPAALLGLLCSESGSRFVLHRVLSSLSGQVSVNSIEGRLLDRLVLSGIRVRNASETIAVERLIVSWNAKRLILGTLDITELTLHQARIELSESRQSDDDAPFELPEKISLPLRLVLEKFLLSDLEILVDDRSFRFDRIQLSARTEGEQLILSSLALDAKPLAATAHGRVALGQGFPFGLNVEWQNLQWPMAGAPAEIQSEQGSLQWSGEPDDFRLTATASLIHPELPKSQMTLNGRGGLNAAVIEKLTLKSTAGTFHLTGKLAWQEAMSFDLTATGQNFNPAIVLPKLPGNLIFNSHIKGKAEETLTLDVELKQLSGKLRGLPVDGKANLHWSSDRLGIDALGVRLGNNRLTADGILAPRQSDLEISLDATDLHQIWPDWRGSLTGGGLVQGAWKNPRVKFQAHGKRLHYPPMEADRLDLDIDYHPESKQASRLIFTANAVQSGDIRVSNARIEGRGNPARHWFSAEVRSSYGDLNAELTGNLKDLFWLGRLSRLSIQNRDWGLWQLKKNADLVIRPQNAGFDAESAEICLFRQSASICTQGQYRAEGDFNVELTASHLPIALARHYFPETLAIEGVVNGQAGLHRQNGVLTGRWRLDMPYGTALRWQNDDGSKDYTLGASSLVGIIDSKRISADLDMALAGNDHVRSQVQIDRNGTQAISGQLSASLAEISWLAPFVPRMTNAYGHLTASLALHGTVARPVALGTIRLRDGAAHFAEHLIDHVNFEAVAGEKADQLRFAGAARLNDDAIRADGFYRYNGDYRITLEAPRLSFESLKPYLPENVSVEGHMTANGMFEQKKGSLVGNLRLEFPESNRIAVKTQETKTSIPLGASLVTAAVTDKIITANFDVGLAGKDFIRGRLQLDSGGEQRMEGRLTASMTEWAPFNPFLPRLSGLQGQLHADLTLKGTMEKPLVQGIVDLNQAAADVPDLGLAIRNITLKSFTSLEDDHRLHIQGAATSGGGSINLDGLALLKPEWQLMLNINGNDFEVARLPEAEIAVAPEFKATFDSTHGNIGGQLKVTRANIQLKQLPENSVKVSSDEIMVGREQIIETAPAPANIDANIEVDLGKNTRFSGLGLQTDLSGKLQVHAKGEKITLQGNVDMSKAAYKRYGQDLTVRKGRFLFSGPADNPWLEVEAIRLSRDRKVTAILELSGPSSHPKTRIYSEPPMPESEALAYLISGRSLNQVTQSEGHLIAGAALSYGAGRLSWLANKLGVDEFEVKEGDTLKDTLVTVGQYLNPDFYVGAKVGLFNQQAALILRRKLTDSLSVESESGESQRIKLNYRFETE
ncbi:MAG: translocation/assembly module TamB domain-containing protein [Gammaproteobacteria bacterium]